MFIRFLVIFAILMLPNISHPHLEKDTDKDGCHEFQDDYHCHSADKRIIFNSNESGYYTVKKFIDGDTLDMANDTGTMRVRLFGVDTPETYKGRKLTKDAQAVLSEKGITEDSDNYACELEKEKKRQVKLGKAATEYVKQKLKGENVFCMFDNSDTFPFIESGDFCRYLAYIFYEDDQGTHFLNIDLIAEGHAHRDYLKDPFRYRWVFIEGKTIEKAKALQLLFKGEKLPTVQGRNTPSPQLPTKLTMSWAKHKGI